MFDDRTYLNDPVCLDIYFSWSVIIPCSVLHENLMMSVVCSVRDGEVSGLCFGYVNCLLWKVPELCRLFCRLV